MWAASSTRIRSRCKPPGGLATGLHKPDLVGHTKRTSAYTRADFKCLREFAAAFSQIITTPHILAETSNLLGNTRRDSIGATFVEIIRVCYELHVAKDALLQQSTDLIRLGVTDAAIVALSTERDFLVVTDDFPLSGVLHSRGVDCLNFNHLRSIAWIR